MCVSMFFTILVCVVDFDFLAADIVLYLPSSHLPFHFIAFSFAAFCLDTGRPVPLILVPAIAPFPCTLIAFLFFLRGDLFGG